MIESEVEQSVRSIEHLIAALESGGDSPTREAARELLDVVLNLHAIALARMTAVIAADQSERGIALLQRLAGEEPVRAVLLLHGLHPETVEERVGKAVERLRPSVTARGLGIKLTASTASIAHIRVRWISAAPTPSDAAALREEIEATIIEAAPDLERLEIEGLDETEAVLVG